MMTTPSSATDCSMAISDELDRIVSDLNAGRSTTRQALDCIVKFVQTNLGLQLSTESLDTKIQGFKLQIDLGSLMTGLSQIKAVKRRIEIIDRKVAVVQKRIKHELEPLLVTLFNGVQSIES